MVKVYYPILCYYIIFYCKSLFRKIKLNENENCVLGGFQGFFVMITRMCGALSFWLNIIRNEMTCWTTSLQEMRDRFTGNRFLWRQNSITCWTVYVRFNNKNNNKKRIFLEKYAEYGQNTFQWYVQFFLLIKNVSYLKNNKKDP